MEEELKILIKVWVSVVLSLTYCYLVVGRIPRGPPRLIALLPIFYLFLLLPLSFSSGHFRGISAFFLSWLGIFKLLLFSYTKGPLASHHLNYFTFVAVASLPIKSKHDVDPTCQKPPPTPPAPQHKHQILGSRLLSTATKGFLLALLLQVYRYKDRLAQYPLLTIYCLHIYLALELLLAFTAAIAGLVGVEIEPQFDRPYLSSSLRDFWGKRWNLMATGILRPTVYDPVRRMAAPAVGARWAAPAAVMATFLVSGLMHELIFWQITRAAPTWEVTWFFVFHGACTAMEGAAARKAGLTGWSRFSCAVYGPMALAFAVLTAYWLFFPPLVRSGVDATIIGEYWVLGRFLEAKGEAVAALVGRLQ
ncbi:hypothetical protein ACLOJK_036007 [Asimina triloba]